MNIGSKQEQTAAVLRTGDPVWEQGFTFLVHNPQADTLTLKVGTHFVPSLFIIRQIKSL